MATLGPLTPDSGPRGEGQGPTYPKVAIERMATLGVAATLGLSFTPPPSRRGFGGQGEGYRGCVYASNPKPLALRLDLRERLVKLKIRRDPVSSCVKGSIHASILEMVRCGGSGGFDGEPACRRRRRLLLLFGQ